MLPLVFILNLVGLSHVDPSLANASRIRGMHHEPTPYGNNRRSDLSL